MTTNPPTENGPVSEPTLEPPEPETDLTLDSPQPVAVVVPAAASTMVPLDQSALPGLEQMAQDFADSIAMLDAHSPEFAQKAESVRTMGDADIRAACAVSNRMLDSPVRAIRREDSTPAPTFRRPCLTFGRRSSVSIPRRRRGCASCSASFRSVTSYATTSTATRARRPHINAILNALYQGQDEIRKDNAALEQEKVHLWETMQRLAQYVYVVQQLDASLTATSRNSRYPTPNTRRRSLTTFCSTSDKSARIC